MKTLLMAFAMLASLAGNDDNAPKKEILEIHFLGDYQDDSVGLILNNNLIIGGRVFNSGDPDFADNVVYVYATEKNYFITYLGDTSKAKVKKPPLMLNFQLNTHDNMFKDNVFFVDPAKGKYILIRKKDHIHLTEEQTNTAPK